MNKKTERMKEKVKNPINKKALYKEAEKAIVEKIGWYSIVITATEENFEHGTGIPIVYKGKYFIVATRHNITKISPEKLRFHWRLNKPLIVKSVDEIASMPGKVLYRPNWRKLPIKQVLKSSYLADLALLKLDDSVSEDKLAFFDISVDSVRKSIPKTKTILMGYPGKLAKPALAIEKKDKIVNEAVFYYDLSEIIEPQDSLENFDPKIHFLATCDWDSLTKPQGMSGCGFWVWDKGEPDKLWLPKIYLVGIQSGYYPRKKLLKGIRMEILLDMLKAI